MDYNTLGILLIVILVILIPYSLFKKKKINTEKAASKLFNAYAERLEVNCNIVDIWRDTYGIGIDSKKKVLLYVNVVNEVQNCIGLDDCKEVYLHKNEQTNTTFGKNKPKIKFLFLKITPISKNEDAHSLELFNDQINKLNGELEFGQKWKKIISEYID